MEYVSDIRVSKCIQLVCPLFEMKVSCFLRKIELKVLLGNQITHQFIGFDLKLNSCIRKVTFVAKVR